MTCLRPPILAHPQQNLKLFPLWNVSSPQHTPDPPCYHSPVSVWHFNRALLAVAAMRCAGSLVNPALRVRSPVNYWGRENGRERICCVLVVRADMARVNRVSS